VSEWLIVQWLGLATIRTGNLNHAIDLPVAETGSHQLMKRGLIFIIVVLVIAVCIPSANAQSASQGGSCSNFASTPSCSVTPTSTSDYLVAWIGNEAGTNTSPTASGCVTWTQLYTSTTGYTWNIGQVTSTSPCTITVAGSGTETSYVLINWFEVSSVSATADGASSPGSCTGGCNTNPMNGPAVTTGTSGDLILIAGQNQTKTDAFSAHTPFTSVFAAANANYYGASGYYVQLSSGSITPTWTTTGNFDGYDLGTLALKSAPPSVSNPTFSLAGGTYSSGLPQSTTVATSTSGAYLCVTSCSGEGCTPATPAASSPPTCSTGTQYSTNSQALSIALGYETFSALGTKSGDTNSGVLTSSQYYSVPLLSNFGQETLSGALGNVSWEGAPIGNGNGQLGWTDGLASPNTGIQFTLVQNPHQYSCTSSPCTVTVTSTTSGNAGIICSGASYTGSTGTGIVISMGTPSAGGTWKHSPASMVNNIGGGGVATATILADDCYYTASLTGGTTSIGHRSD
jgi:hypothetical protein